MTATRRRACCCGGQTGNPCPGFWLQCVGSQPRTIIADFQAVNEYYRYDWADCQEYRPSLLQEKVVSTFSASMSFAYDPATVIQTSPGLDCIVNGPGLAQFESVQEFQAIDPNDPYNPPNSFCLNYVPCETARYVARDIQLDATMQMGNGLPGAPQRVLVSFRRNPLVAQYLYLVRSFAGICSAPVQVSELSLDIFGASQTKDGYCNPLECAETTTVVNTSGLGSFPVANFNYCQTLQYFDGFGQPAQSGPIFVKTEGSATWRIA